MKIVCGKILVQILPILWIDSAMNSALCSVLDGLRTSTRPIVPISPDKLNLWAKNLLLLKIDWVRSISELGCTNFWES